MRFSAPHFRSVGKQRFEESPQASVTDCQDSRRQGNEDNVGKASDDQQKLGRGALAVVEIVDRYDAGSPRCNEERDERKNDLGNKRVSALHDVCWINMLKGCFHLGRSPLNVHPLNDRCILHRFPRPVVGVEYVKGGQVG